MMAKLTTLKNRVQLLPARLQTINPDSWRAGKTTAAQRGYGYKWQQARLVHLNAHPLCAYCDRLGRVTEATVVDHSTPHRGDMKLFWDRSLWVSLCAPCHSSVKQAEEAAGLR
ncbi:HNH endonuclease domain protein [Pseudomonas syringae pv. papulans]|nr:HNH endonuclease domain protein [Pseudomonas syringae pv. papulans]RMV53072.1 HNH endonuclease domain protein [Pseudomonas syringae pv. papulans]